MRKNDKGFVRFLSFSLVKGKLYLSIGLTEGRNESTVGRIKTVGTLFSKLCSWWCGEARRRDRDKNPAVAIFLE